MRALFLTRYGPKGASSRVRAYQFMPALQAAGIEVEVTALLPDSYLAQLYSGASFPARRLAQCYAERIQAMRRRAAFDVVWVEKEALPWLPASFERSLLRGTPYVLDFDDATFHAYDQHPSPVIRKTLGNRIDRLMQGAAVVVVGNTYLANRAQAAGAPRVEMLPSVIDLARYPPAQHPPEDQPFTIGWIGSGGSDRALDAIHEVLREFTTPGDVRLRLIGSDGRRLSGVHVESVPWSEETEVAQMSAFDVGIMPLPDEPWTHGKCGYKLIQYMGCSIPVVASPIGINKDLVDEGRNGFLASTREQWLRSLQVLREDKALRSTMGQEGRAKVEAGYSLAWAAPRLVDILRSV